MAIPKPFLGEPRVLGDQDSNGFMVARSTDTPRALDSPVTELPELVELLALDSRLDLDALTHHIPAPAPVPPSIPFITSERQRFRHQPLLSPGDCGEIPRVRPLSTSGRPNPLRRLRLTRLTCLAHAVSTLPPHVGSRRATRPVRWGFVPGSSPRVRLAGGCGWRWPVARPGGAAEVGRSRVAGDDGGPGGPGGRRKRRRVGLRAPGVPVLCAGAGGC